MSAKRIAISILLAGTMAGAVSGSVLAADEAIDNPDHCKVVKLKPGEHQPSGSLASSVTAGNGKVTAHTSDGNGVTVHSGNGNVSSSVATTGSGNGTTTVTTSDGNCTIYVHPGKKED
jgi:hypothetical protein